MPTYLKRTLAVSAILLCSWVLGVGLAVVALTREQDVSF